MQDKQHRKIEALGRQELISFSEVAVPTNTPQKFVGELLTHSRFIVDRIQGTVCFFDKDGKLLDVISTTLEGVGSVPPGESRKFYLERVGRRDYAETPEQVKEYGVRTSISFVDLDATEPK